MRKALLRHGPGLAAVVLAAGGSTRLGRSKQLVRVRGEPLIVRAARLAGATVNGPVIVVLGADALRLRACLRRRQASAAVIRNAGWRSGMAGSLRTGIGQVPRDCAGALVLLTDQVRVTRAELGLLVARWRQHPGRAAAACWNEHIGAPAILPRRLFGTVRTISGDQGARRLLRDETRLTRVPVPGAAFDLDTPEDLAALAWR